MNKPNRNSKRLSVAILTGLLLMSSCPSGVCQDNSTAGGTASASPPKTPEGDSRSASDTIGTINEKVEKKVEQEIENPQPTSTPKAPSVDDLLQSIKESAAQQGSQPAPDKTEPGKNLGPTPVDPATVLMRPNANDPKTVDPQNMRGITIAPIAKPEEKPAATPAAKAPAAPSGKLFGRIEQLSGEGDPKMPVLTVQKAELDPRGKLLPGEIEKYSGSIAKSFPTEFRGIWGGTIKVWSYRYSPDYLKVDRAEASSTANILKNGRSGAVNFHFYQDPKNHGMALEPANVLMTVPLKDTNTFAQMQGGMNSQMGAFAGAFNQMMGNMEAPCVAIHFGKAATSSMERGISGNDFRQDVAKNVIRDLGPGVLEQQIVTKYTTRTPEGKVNSGYDESVMRFKKLNEGQLYVLCAAVKYSSSGKYLSKLIMYGTVDKGRQMQTNPMSNMNSMMGGMMNLNDMQKMMGGAAQQGGTIQVPHGGFGGMGGNKGGFPFGNLGPGMQIPGGSGGAGGAGGMNDILKQLNQLQNGSR